MNTSKILTAILAGVVVGLLIAPDKGSETRRKVSKKVNEVSDVINDAIDRLREQGNAWADEADEMQEDVKEKFSEAIES